MQSILHTACVVSYNSKDCRRTLGGGQGRPWNSRPEPSLIANVSAAFERVCMCVCTHIYDSVCACVFFFLGNGWRRGLFLKFTFAEALRTLATGSARKKKNMDTSIYIVFGKAKKL